MQVQGTVISVSPETQVKKNGGGTYAGWELIYKTPDGEVRTIAKPIQGLRFNAPLKTALNELAGGDQFTLEQEKNQAGFYDVKAIVKGWGNAGEPNLPKENTVTLTQSAEKPKANSYQASSYPTAEERAKTQTSIIRQSCLAQANATLAVGSKGLKPEEVLAVAEVYVDWVTGTKRGMEALQEMEDDIPV